MTTTPSRTPADGLVLFGTGLLAVTVTPSLDIVALGAFDKGVSQVSTSLERGDPHRGGAAYRHSPAPLEGRDDATVLEQYA
ncbi:hypothetical protein GCM10022403_057410 [Streptomyces coacervatus]|uniref:Uncharacterized protein n=1 Tax=Streptomyces coacervatus TaxID=647381 RepID=A0ABP7IEC5_9ACTN|nr:hypothetical protein [Streptomyces coacervatus]MDF2268900.1 hypothetical protein [Streptomyces coacervatus]